ncbi:cytochrome P450 [Obba rivulosa]|uniref:Cytochrome P450 n=1 Tax=Obba rivulosa TaxID=1052685 RepID=A0A8E2DS93_9APHY|nr:cytochrome P450 [Obba rivulosa]
MHLGPIIEERKAKIAKWGANYPGKPRDFLSWLIDSTPRDHHYTTDNIALRMLNVNFVALHSTSMSFVHAFYTLAAQPKYIDTLRAEMRIHLGDEPRDWTKDGFARCWKLDSVLKENQRLYGLRALSLPRKALRTYTFKDGTTVPEGAMIAAVQTATHLDPANDGFQFPQICEQALAQERHEGEDVAEDAEEDDWRYRLTGIGLGYLAFGGGRRV